MDVNTLTVQEKRALKQFRDNIDDVVGKLSKYEQHDVNLLRWIKARDFNLKAAEDMLRKSVAWREENNMDKYLTNNFSEYLLPKLRFTPCGHDKKGALICILPTGSGDFRQLLQDGYKKEMTFYIAQIIERGCHYMTTISTDKKFYYQFTLIIDLEGFSAKQFLNRDVLRFFIEFLRLFEANYPERMRAAFVVNAPKLFEIFFPIIKPLLTQHTLSKVKIFASNAEQARGAILEEIDDPEIPSKYGGSNTSHPWYDNNYGTEWPVRAIKFPANEFQTVMIPPRDKFVKNIMLKAGTHIAYNFKTEDYDIGFEFLQNGSPLFSYAKADAHKHIQDGCVAITENGTYSMVFDNSYSRYRSKTVHFAYRIVTLNTTKSLELMGQ